ncbi:hypothetical protein Tsubulata_014254, partial [Turnera subulata]
LKPPHMKKPVLCSFHIQNNPNARNKPAKPKAHAFGPVSVNPTQVSPPDNVKISSSSSREYEERKSQGQEGGQQMVVLCGVGYWVQGFRCFPWLALNFHLAHYLSLHPSTLQLLQHSANLPFVVKPLFGLLSDAIYIGGARRIPYIVIGGKPVERLIEFKLSAFLQILSWISLALIPVAREALPILMPCMLLGNMGASITEVAQDALVAEYGKQHRMGALQSYAFMALAVGGVLGNLLGGYFLTKSPPKTMFMEFAVLLSLQLFISSAVREKSLGLTKPSDQNVVRKPVLESVRTQLNDLKMALREDSISRPLTWIVASIAIVPILSGSIFCYQTQCLHLDPTVIGMSRVTGQLMLLSLTILYDRYWKEIPMRKLIGAVQINLKFGIPNEMFVCCFSGLAETLAQFKMLPFSVLLASLCPQGCEGSLTSFLASAFCLSSIVGGFLGVGLASVMGITSANFSGLPVGILIQVLAAVLPLGWIHLVPTFQPAVEKERKRGMSKRTRKIRRVGRVMLRSIY